MRFLVFDFGACALIGTDLRNLWYKIRDLGAAEIAKVASPYAATRVLRDVRATRGVLPAYARARQCPCGTEIASSAACCAMCGTEVVYGATQLSLAENKLGAQGRLLLCDVRYCDRGMLLCNKRNCDRACCYARNGTSMNLAAMQCAVLTYTMLLPLCYAMCGTDLGAAATLL
eukprot:3024329-Rhodomonas_salina.4